MSAAELLTALSQAIVPEVLLDVFAVARPKLVAMTERFSSASRK